MPKLSEILFGKKESTKQLPTMTPEQMEIFNLIKQGLQKGEGPYADIFGGFDEAKFNEQVAQPNIRQFQEQVLPALREKFAGGDQYWGSGRQRYESRAATDLQDRLAQLMYGARQQREQQRAGGVQNLLGQRMFESIYKGREPGAVEGFLHKFINSAGEEFGKRFGNIGSLGSDSSSSPQGAAQAASAIIAG